MEGIPTYQQRLILAGRELTDMDATSSDIGLVDDMSLHLVLNRRQEEEAAAAAAQEEAAKVAAELRS